MIGFIFHAIAVSMKKIQILFPEPQMDRLRKAARNEDKPISEIVRRATEEYLDKLPGAAPDENIVTIPTFDGGKTFIDPGSFREAAHEDRAGFKRRNRTS